MPGELRRRRPALASLPDRPVPYHQLLRGPRRRWWHPLVSLLCLIGCVVALLLVALGIGGLLDVLLPERLVGSSDDDLSPLFAFELDLTLALLVPASMAGVALVYWRRPGWLSSVVGRLRWRWLLRCVLVVVPVFVVSTGLAFVLDPPAAGRPDHWVQLLVLSLVMTPLQAAGEEYLFRGWILQNVGACVARPRLGLVVATAVSAALFALAHGSLHPWILVELGAFAVAACLLTWRTGGLEAAIVVHAANNVVIGIITSTYGGYAEQFVDAETTGSPLSALTTVLVLAGAFALVSWQARRAGVARTTMPAPAVWTYGPLDPVDPPDATWFAPLGR